MISENFWLLSGALVVGALFGINSKLGKEILSRDRAFNKILIHYSVWFNHFLSLDTDAYCL